MESLKRLRSAYKRASTYWALWTLFVLVIAIRASSATKSLNIRFWSIFLSLVFIVGLPKLIIFFIKSFGRFVFRKPRHSKMAETSPRPKRSGRFYLAYYSLAIPFLYFDIDGALILGKSIKGESLSNAELNKGGLDIVIGIFLFIALTVMLLRSGKRMSTRNFHS
jgi:NADH:ubiquinone oxidoreductase subunit 3 (subunit A)